jgi:hypothetical protein
VNNLDLEEVREIIKSRAKDLDYEPAIKLDSGTSIKPSVILEDENIISIGYLSRGQAQDGSAANQWVLWRSILHSNTSIYIYMYDKENSSDNIFQYAKFFQNFSQSLK